MEEVLYKGTSDKTGQPQGQGTVTFTSGAVYEGEWINGTPQGHGKLRYADGDVFIGNFVDGQPYGQGTLIIDGNEYSGEFKKEGKGLIPHGRGIMRYADGNVYNGEWVDGKREGMGENKYVYGAVYNGPWLNDQRSGYGSLRFPNGTVFKGNWYKNERENRGTLWLAEGMVQVVLFAPDGRPTGDGVMWSQDRKTSWRMRDGKPAEEISASDAVNIATNVVGLPIPFRAWYECCSSKPP